MPRRVHGFKRDVLPDPIYNSVLVTKLINNIMYDGKKGVAQKIVYDAFIMPNLEVKAVRRGGSNYQVPMEVRADRRQTLGLRWLTIYARSRGDKTMSERLAAEIIDAVNNAGGAVKKKEDTHKMAEANKAFAHYRW